jgi:HAE1 family hydrophobic/amphiphilic exporter-1
MTTVARSAGMLPTALGLGEGAGFRTSMAIAVIGGLISSTALSLVLVPVLYSLVSSVERRVNPLFARLVTKRTAGDDALMSHADGKPPATPITPAE